MKRISNRSPLLLTVLVSTLNACGPAEQVSDSKDAVDANTPTGKSSSALEIDIGSALGSPITASTTCGSLNESTPSCTYNGAPDKTYIWTAPFAGGFEFTTQGSGYLLTRVPEFPASAAGSRAPEPRPQATVRKIDPNSPFSLLPVVPGRSGSPVRKGKKPEPGFGPTALPDDKPSWLDQVGTTDTDEAAELAVSCEGVYTVGYSSGSLDGTTIPHGADLVLVKHNLSGTLEWKKQLGSPPTSAIPPNDYGSAVATFDVGGSCTNPVIYVVGHTDSPLPDGGGHAGSFDAFVAKYDKDGNRLWLRQFGTSYSDRANSVATDKNGNVYIAGTTTGIFGQNSPAAGQDAFIVMYSPDGIAGWRAQLNSGRNEEGRGVACDANGFVYLGGTTNGGLNGNANADTGNSPTRDIFLVQYAAATGSIIWTKQLGTQVEDILDDLATSRRSSGVTDIYLAGHTLGSLAGTNQGDYDALLMRFDATGANQGQHQFGTSGRDLLFGVASDGGGNVYVTGTSTYDIHQNVLLPGSNPDDTDVFVRSFKEDLTPKFTRQIGSDNPQDPDYQVDYGAAIATDNGEGVYVAGFTEGQFSTLGIGIPNVGANDLIVFKYNEGCKAITPNQCQLSYGWGDPHYVTFDGYAYDFQGYGEFILAMSTPGDLVVQARQQAWNGSPHVSVFKAVAAKVVTDRVAYYLGASPALRINGVPVNVTKETPLRGGGRIIPRGSGYLITWPSGDHLVLTPNGSYMNADLLLSPARRGNVRGPLGNFNGNHADDFALRDGTLLAAPPSFTQMYVGSNAYVNSWRISQAESLFDYASGESTTTFTNVNFPAVPPQVSSTQRQQAEQICLNAGVTQLATLWSCITDVIFTNDTSFASGAASVQASAQAQGATPPPEPPPQSVYHINFDGAVNGAEWNSTLVSSTPLGNRTFLGQFGNQAVQLSLQGLPAHNKLTISFDLYVINGWDGNGSLGPSRFQLSAAGYPMLLDTTFSNTRSSQSYPGNYPSTNKARTGALERNTLLYPKGDSVYRLKYTLNHTSSNLTLSFSAAGLSGINDEAWGLDNVEVQLQ